jgi:hypothetical protein
MSTQAIPNTPAIPLKPPSQAEIMQLLRARMPGLAIYNPSTDWLRMQVHGIEHYLPPDLDGAVEPHPTNGEPTQCDGTYLVRGRFLTQKDSSGKLIEGQDAQSIVAFIIHRDRYGEMGVVWLPGRSAEEDEALKAMGREQWLKFQNEADDRIIARRREFKANWERNPAKQGVPCPAPTRTENFAMERMQERETKRIYGFECNVDECPGYATDDWAKYVKHMHAAHHVTARRTKTGVITLTNQKGDTITIQPMEALDGNPVEIQGDDPEVETETAQGLAAAAQELPKAPKVAPGRGRGKRGKRG